MSPKQAFTEAYRRTLAATSATLVPEHFEECWRLVGHLHPSVFDGAATRLNATCKFLPKASEWLEVCRALDGERRMADLVERLRASESRRPEKTYHCPKCHDRGIETDLRCTESDWCGNCRRHGTRLGGIEHVHTYARPCDCRDTNPAYQEWLLTKQKAVQGKQTRRSHDAAA